MVICVFSGKWTAAIFFLLFGLVAMLFGAGLEKNNNNP